MTILKSIGLIFLYERPPCLWGCVLMMMMMMMMIRYFCGSISICDSLYMQNLLTCATALCSKQDLHAFWHSLCYTCWYSSEPWHCFTTSLLQADQLSTSGSVMVHLQPLSHSSQFGKRILHHAPWPLVPPMNATL